MTPIPMNHQHPHKTVAIVTASYRGDLDRFALLAETMDRFVTGHTRHLVLVASRDVPLFARFAGQNRQIVDEADLLPWWLRRLPDPVSGFRRDIWVGPRVWPMRGWHVQQLRRLAVARHIDEAAVLHADSDVAFVAPHDVRSDWRNGTLRLYRVEDALLAPEMDEQRNWSALAARTLGLGRLGLPETAGRHDYINTLVAWSVPAVRRMLDRIEAVSGRDFVSALGAARTLSECMLYGRFVEDVEGMAGHVASPEALCRVYWGGPALSAGGIAEFVAMRQPHQVAVGLQSFVGMPMADIRAALAA
jgi:Family of unknown function (DUF6492)